MDLLRSRCTRFGGAGILFLFFGFGMPQTAHAQQSTSGGMQGLMTALNEMVSLLPKFNKDPSELRHLEKALQQLLDVMDEQHHHHKHHLKHHKGSFGKGMNLTHGNNKGGQTSQVSLSNPGSQAGTATNGKAAKTPASTAQNTQKQNTAGALSPAKTTTDKTAHTGGAKKGNAKGMQLAMNLAHSQMPAHVGNQLGHNHAKGVHNAGHKK